MNTTVNDMVAEIVTLPRRFHKQRDKSMVTLLQETGYFELHDLVTENDIHVALVKDPDCVPEWIQLSEDQRTSSGWYISRNDEGLFEVGFFDINADPHSSNRVQYENVIDACAAFIKHDIELIRIVGLEYIHEQKEKLERKQAFKARNLAKLKAQPKRK
jgi:hypothetical protein